MKYIVLSTPYSLSIYVIVLIVLGIIGGLALAKIIKERNLLRLLLEDLKDADWRIHEKAMKKLIRLEKAAVIPLISLLSSRYAHLRWQAVEALGKIKDSRAIPLLIDKLDDPEAKVVEKSIIALACIGGKSISYLGEQFINCASDKRDKILTVLVKIGAPAVPEIIKMLNSRNGDIRWRAIKALGQIKDSRSIQILSHILSSKNKEGEERWLAAQALGNIGDSRAIKILKMAAADDDVHLQKAAVNALAILKKTQKE
ncbi:MAG: HEAT repeat domain-containing protein [Candidatus Omnitrophota bacterium]